MLNLNKIETVKNILTTEKNRSAWNKAVNSYAQDLLEEIEQALSDGYIEAELNSKEFLKACLNGASDWSQYSWGGCSLIYNVDIAKLTCNATELKKCKNGELPPNKKEQWLDVQARCLFQAHRKLEELLSN